MRKILFFFFTSLLLFSCATSKPPYSRFSNTVDFSDFTRKGFFITESNSVSFDYDPLGSVTAVVQGGYEVLNQETIKSSDEVYGTNAKVRYGSFIPASVEDALDELYNSALELGANGIINFKLTYYPSKYEGIVLITPSSYVISGMAIKRKNS